jgi:poly(A) RNA polymerase
MSELLYLYGELDRRVRPLVFTVRRWAKEQGLIQDLRPTPSFTNFSLTLLVLVSLL